MKALKISLAVVALLIVAVVVFLLTFDVGQYKGLIQDQAKAATGRELKIGDIKMGLSLTPTVIITDVTFANAPWGSKPEMLTAKSVSVGLSLMPLLSGEVKVSDVALAGADALLEVNRDGKPNWEFGEKSASTETPPITIDTVAVDGLKLAYRDAKTGQEANVALGKAAVRIAGDVANLEISSLALDGVAADVKDKTQSAKVALGKLALKANGPITAPTSADADLEGLVASFKMPSQEGALTLEKAKVNAKGSGQAFDKVAVELGKLAGDFKDATQQASVSADKASLGAKGPVTGLSPTSATLDGAKINYKGAGAPMEAAFSAFAITEDGKVNIDGTLSGQGIKAAGTIPPLGELTAMTKPMPAKLVVEALGLKVDADVVADMSKKVPAFSGTVNIPKLDLAALMPPPPAPENGAKPAKAVKPPPGTKVFPDDPLPWDMLGTANADVKLTIGALTLPDGIPLENVVVPVKLEGGKLDAKGVGADILGGRVSMDLGLTQAAKALSLKLKADGFTAEKLSKEMKVTDLVTQGPLDIAVDVRGSGHSVRALMAGLNGSVVGGMGESRIRNDALNMIGADVIMSVLSSINPMGNKDPYTVARCAVVNFQVTNGVANTEKGIALVTDKMEVVSTGKIDLAQEQVDLAMKPKATSGLAVGMGNLTQAVKLAGPLADPGVKVDAKGAVKALGSLGAAFATGGASLLAQGAVDKMDGGDPCAYARKWQTAGK